MTTTAAQAAEIAVEVDRLMIAVYRRVGPDHGDHIKPAADDLGLDERTGLALLLGVGDLLAAGTLTAELARLRTRYYDPEATVADIEALASAGLVTGDPWRAHGRLMDLLSSVYGARAAVASSLWAGQLDLVRSALERIEPVCRRLTEQSGIHPLAESHAALPLSPELPDVFVQRLVTLRYVRMDDHAAAWAAVGQTATGMAAQPRDHAEWTNERREIETATNERSAISLATIADPAGLLAELRQLAS